jgi:hypothetical protein
MKQTKNQLYMQQHRNLYIPSLYSSNNMNPIKPVVRDLNRQIEKYTDSGRRDFIKGLFVLGAGGYVLSKIPRAYAEPAVSAGTTEYIDPAVSAGLAVSAAAAARADLAVSADSTVPTAQTIRQIPPAIIRPKIDGQYTPKEELELTDFGQQLVENDKTWMPKDEWSDAREMPYSLLARFLSNEYKPEWYISLKQDGKRLYSLVDAVSELKVGAKSAETGYKDLRQNVSFVFDTNNTKITEITPTSNGVYFIEFHFLSDDINSLRSGPSIYTGSPAPLLPQKYYTYKAGIGISPHSTTPHILIESSFDLDLLTKYTNTFDFRSFAEDINIDVLLVDGNFDFRGEQPLPEMENSGILLASALAILGAANYYQKNKNNKK